MNCREFESHFESLLVGRVEPDVHDACVLHAETCADCGELLEAVGGLATGTPDPEGESLVASVLAATVGSTCTRAQGLLPAFVDRELTSPEQQLVEMHLVGCSHCSRLAATLVTLTEELPKLAEIPLDARFTHEVLAATSTRQSPFWNWLKSHWSAWIQRPRFAMEAAYVGVLLLMVVLGAFSTPVAALPQKGVELMQSAPDSPSIWTRTQEGLGTFWESVASMFEKAEGKPDSDKETP